MTRANGHSFSGTMMRVWRLAVLASVGAIGGTTHAQAALFYWHDSEPGLWQMQPSFQQPPRRSAPRRSHSKKQPPEKEVGSKPVAPLIISISIDKQRLKIYDANGFFAEAPVSTGMRGHPTPMGVFSVIQKQRFHVSNIYSGAPMPFMQRITWSGVAMHAGVLPGYPASHGCIRMPAAFAVKMYAWTRTGARVIVTPGELAPTGFSHPLLTSLKVAPQPTTATEPENAGPAAANPDNRAPGDKPGSVAAKLELLPTVGNTDQDKSAVEQTTLVPVREKTQTADARTDAGASKSPRSLSDATANKTGRPEISASSTEPPARIEEPATGAADAAENPLRPERQLSHVESTVGRDVRPAEPDAATGNATEAAKPAIVLESTKAASDKPIAKPEPPKITGRIAVFISRKDSRLYVRQNFSPLFEAPVTIAPSDRPLGTHVFTAGIDSTDPNAVHWSVVSVPMKARAIERSLEDEQILRHRRIAPGAALESRPLPVPDTPAEALDRISVPSDVMARINEALTTGASIIVSDQGLNQGETGEGTDFIVSLY
jgi:L,D-transpeptidase-like protein